MQEHYFLSQEAGQRIKISAFWSMGLLLITGFLFFFFPQIDLQFSGLFVGSDGLFTLQSNRNLAIFFKTVDWISRAVIAGLLFVSIYFWFKKSSRFILTTCVLLSLLLGPTVMVNNVFKEYWDRARPREVQEFKGTKKFTPAWVISDQCPTNCSFTSGHAAAGFAPFALYFVLRRRQAQWALASGFAFGLGIGYTRIIVGAHFLSDIIFSGFIVFICSLLVSSLFWLNRTSLNQYLAQRTSS